MTSKNSEGQQKNMEIINLMKYIQQTMETLKTIKNS